MEVPPACQENIKDEVTAAAAVAPREDPRRLTGNFVIGATKLHDNNYSARLKFLENKYNILTKCRFHLAKLVQHMEVEELQLQYRRFGRKPKIRLGGSTTSTNRESEYESPKGRQSESEYKKTDRIREVRYTAKDLHSDYASANFLKTQRSRDQQQRTTPNAEQFDSGIEEETRENYANFPPPDEPEPSFVGEVSPYKKKTQITKHKQLIRLQQNVEHKVKTNEKGIKWTYLSVKDYDFVNLMIKLRGRQSRKLQDKILLEGKRLVNDALLAGLKLEVLFFVRPEILDELNLEPGMGQLFRISESRMNAWSDMHDPPGVFAVVEKPTDDFIAERQSLSPVIPLTAVIDQMRDPGNVGSLIRTLAAVGCEKIICLNGTADVWAPSVLRGGMGAHFNIPIVQQIGWEYVRSFLPPDCNMFLADSNSYEIMSEAESYKEPMADYYASHRSKKPDAALRLEYDEEKKSKIIVDRELMTPNRKYLSAQLPTYSLYDVDFAASQHVALVVGGETLGLSAAAHQFAYKYYGVRCHVPMSNSINSLNVVTATGVIAYEIKRQLESVGRARKLPLRNSETEEAEDENFVHSAKT